MPLQLFTFTGLVVSFLSSCCGYLLVRRFVLGAEAEGVFTLFAILFFEFHYHRYRDAWEYVRLPTLARPPPLFDSQNFEKRGDRICASSHINGFCVYSLLLLVALLAAPWSSIF